jgi:hypothetical protein
MSWCLTDDGYGSSPSIASASRLGHAERIGGTLAIVKRTGGGRPLRARLVRSLRRAVTKAAHTRLCPVANVALFVR